MFARFGRAMYRRRWLVIGVWLLAVLIAAPWFPKIGSFLQVGGFSSSNIESAQARETLAKNLGQDLSSVVVVYSSSTLTADDPRFIQEVRASLAGVSAAPGVQAVLMHTTNVRQISPDKHTAYETIVIHSRPEQGPRFLPAVEARISRPRDLRMIVAGSPVFYADIVRLSAADLRRAETVAFPIAAVVLALVFGSVVAAAVPLVIGGASVLVTLALIALVAQFHPMSIFVLNVTTMLGLGLGVDYALFITNRFREEIGRHPGSIEDAVAMTLATSGRAVFFSGLTVCVGLLGLIGFDFMILSTVGIAGSMVVLLTVIAAMTLLPAGLGVLGPRINSLSVRLPAVGVAGFWYRLSRVVMRHPLPIGIPVLAVLVLLGYPSLNIDLSSPDASILPVTVPSRQGFDLLKQSFGNGALDPVVVVVKATGPVLSADNVGKLYDFTHQLERDPRIAKIDSVVTIDPRLTREQYQLLYADPQHIGDRYAQAIAASTTKNDTAVLNVISKYPPLSDESRGIVAEIRQLRTGYPWQVQVDGGAAEVTDVVNRLYSEFPGTILFIAAATYTLLLVLFRSVILPLKALVMNTLSLIASYGALVFVFQEGHFSRLLHFSPLGFIEASLPIIMFCTLFGLSMDYEVFLLSRIQETYEASGDNALSVASGLQSSGKIITSAALIVVCVSLSFVSADIVLIKALGLGVAVAVAVDATIVRALLVPATMQLLGKWNWWAPRLRIQNSKFKMQNAKKGADVSHFEL
ncbi:MAG: MMPL family transporter [Chloroflexota bacterium]|nr:MMPL family transporter [Chloroflexota bacterium]